jgi:hypothetical protein
MLKSEFGGICFIVLSMSGFMVCLMTVLADCSGETLYDVWRELKSAAPYFKEMFKWLFVTRYKVDGVERVTELNAEHSVADPTGDVLKAFRRQYVAEHPEKAAEALGLPENEEVLMIMDLGYAAEGSGPLPNHESRKPLSETVTYI